ncbi:hypothetical protein DOY81_007258 [Sarcophaga bullata]|nr:hypothetical protein DOY81_007258 [Sarcophaga bullata]
MSIAAERLKSSVSEQKTEHRGSYRKSSKIQEELAAQEKKHEEMENLRKLKELMQFIEDRENAHDDDRDVSQQPSYSKFQLPYTIKCRNRYNACKKLYEQRFQHEIEHLIAQQATGYEAARLNRHLCITSIWPPLHSLSEITHTQRYFFSLTNKERQRLNWIMTTNII